MILADTSVWIEHFRDSGRASELPQLLEDEEIATHPWVVGELTLGDLGRRRHQVLADLKRLPSVEAIADDEILAMIEARRLYSSGLGWVDAGLLAAALAGDVLLWTFDGPLRRAAAGHLY